MPHKLCPRWKSWWHGDVLHEIDTGKAWCQKFITPFPDHIIQHNQKQFAGKLFFFPAGNKSPNPNSNMWRVDQRVEIDLLITDVTHRELQEAKESNSEASNIEAGRMSCQNVLPLKSKLTHCQTWINCRRDPATNNRIRRRGNMRIANHRIAKRKWGSANMFLGAKPVSVHGSSMCNRVYHKSLVFYESALHSLLSTWPMFFWVTLAAWYWMVCWKQETYCADNLIWQPASLMAQAFGQVHIKGTLVAIISNLSCSG